MSEHYWVAIRNQLVQEIELHAQPSAGSVAILIHRLTLRAPKRAEWGDLCTNVAQLLGGSQDGNCLLQADLIRGNLLGIDWVESASLADNGFLNITLKQDRLAPELSKIDEQGLSYGLTGLATHCPAIEIERPGETDDLLSLRQVWNGTYLQKLCELANVAFEVVPWPIPDLRGFSTSAALSKCGPDPLRLALLANGADFSVRFSPMLAIDRNADNPVFFVPYAEARLQALLADYPMTENIPFDGGLLALPAEINLMKKLVSWPMVVRNCLRDGDMVNLVAFLQQVSLLFFRLYEQEHIQSSDYLQENPQKSARLQLLRVTKGLLTRGLDLMDIQRAEEFI